MASPSPSPSPSPSQVGLFWGRKVKCRGLVPSSWAVFFGRVSYKLKCMLAAVVLTTRVAFYCGRPAVTRIHNLHYPCAGVEFNYNFNCCKCTMMHKLTENKSNQIRLGYILFYCIQIDCN